MMEDFKTHTLHYLVLLTILAGGFLGVLFFSQDKGAQFLVILATAVAYFLWGIIHHLLEDNLNLKIMIEYTLFATLGVVVFNFVMGGL